MVLHRIAGGQPIFEITLISHPPVTMVVILRRLLFFSMRKRFSIRVLLVVTCLAAIVLRFGPNLYRRVKFVDHYNGLAAASADWERKPIRGSAEGYEFRADNGVWLSVWTSEHSYVDKYSLAVPTEDAIPDPRRFFVVPPGKWVYTIDDVIATWDEFD